MNDASMLIEGLGNNIAIFTDLVDSLPDDVMDVRRRPGFWTIAEHISHLAQVQPMLLDRLRRFEKEQRPKFEPYIPGEGEEESSYPERMDNARAMELFSRYRKRQIECFESADETLWRKSADHPEYQRYGFRILARHILMHDHWHMYRMEELWLTRDEYLTEVA